MLNINTTSDDSGAIEMQRMYPAIHHPGYVQYNHPQQQQQPSLPVQHQQQQHFQHPQQPFVMYVPQSMPVYPQQPVMYPAFAPAQPYLQQQPAYVYNPPAIAVYPSAPPAADRCGGKSTKPMTPSVVDDGLQKRCLNCGLFFDAAANSSSACRYHPGKYKTPDSVSAQLVPASGAFLRWSCCRKSDKDTPGCRQSHHVVDIVTSNIIAQFQSAVSDDCTTSSCAVSSPNVDGPLLSFSDIQDVDSQKPTTTRTQSEYKHRVRRTDTLSGIALRYGVTTKDVKQANKLTTDEVITRKELIIPNPKRIPDDTVDVEEPKLSNTLLLMFMHRTGSTSKSEAKFYLDDNEYDVEAAIVAYKEDVAWERDRPLVRKAPKGTK